MCGVCEKRCKDTFFFANRQMYIYFFIHYTENRPCEAVFLWGLGALISTNDNTIKQPNEGTVCEIS